MAYSCVTKPCLTLFLGSLTLFVLSPRVQAEIPSNLCQGKRYHGRS